MSEMPEKVTPAMRQYFRFKKQYPQCVLFFRMGDFYEMFYDDAKLAHKVLGVTLTQRTEGVPMAGVPYHAVENYLRRMIEAGHRVAVCEQVEDPKQAKGVVERDVTRVVTPGTLTDEAMLEEGRTNPLAAVQFLDQGEGSGRAAVAWAELSTGAFSLATFGTDELADELARIAPSELLYVETANNEPPPRVKAVTETLGCAASGRPGWQFRLDEALETLCRQFQVSTLEGFGLADDDPALGPASAIVHYLLETQKSVQQSNGHARLGHLQPPKRFGRDEHLVIDQTSLRSLEIEQTLRSGRNQGSLVEVLQDCRTGMGKRLLRQWLCYPLRERAAIEERQRVVGALVDDSRFLQELRDTLDDVQDVERITGRIAVQRATPRDLVALGRSCLQAKKLAELLAERPSVKAYHDAIAACATALDALGGEIEKACVEAPPGHLREGGLIRDGYDKLLDEARNLQRDSNTWLAAYQKELIESTGITNIKVGFNRVFGYYIELSAANRDRAPDDWSRKQTLKNAERFITPQLKEYEGKVLTAQQRAIAREQELFARLCDEAQKQLPALRALAGAAAALDVLACFARRAVRFRYVKPTMVDEPVLHIEAGRHPVLDELLGDRFVANDVELGRHGVTEAPRHEGEDTEDASRSSSQASRSATLALITGPNMAGKSTYIRQAALITLLAHTGSFVPATRATVGLCDRIFTRIGASDELHAGQSTFMVEMTETANICHHATDRSLVILDEIGRGTSTLDGLSLAWAIAEFLAQRGSRTLFATHYHELTDLAERFDNVMNLNVTVREWQDEIVFLHRIVPGATDRSYGIHVAKIAGLPQQVIRRANELLSQLAVNHQTPDAVKRSAKRQAAEEVDQLPLFTQYVSHPALDELRDIDLNNLTPMQAFDLLRKLRDEVEQR